VVLNSVMLQPPEVVAFNLQPLPKRVSA